MVRGKRFPIELDEETPAFVKLYTLGALFEIGKRDAADMAAIVCDEDASEPLPRWAIAEFAHRAREDFGLRARKKGRGAGRGAYEAYNKNLTYAAVTAAAQHSERLRKSKYKLAQEVLRTRQLKKTLLAITKAYKEGRKKKLTPIESLVRDFSDAIDIEYMTHAEGVPV
jgi:hypothetical protein